MRKIKITALILAVIMVLCVPATVSAAAKISTPQMRVGYSPQSFGQMTKHSSKSYSASTALRPYKINSASGELVWYCVRQKVNKGTYKCFKMVDKLDACINFQAICVMTSDLKKDYTYAFNVSKKKSDSKVTITISAKSCMLKLLKKKKMSFDLYIICTTKSSASIVDHGHVNGKQWRIGNRVTMYLGKNKKNSNYSYICGDKPAEASKTVKLCYTDGTVYKTLDNTDTNVFPSYWAEGYNEIGWSTKKGQNSDPEYLDGDEIPAGSGTYYMVSCSDEQIQSTLRMPADDTVVYFVGDSRTEYTKWNLQSVNGGILSHDGEQENKPLDGKVEFVSECGMGLDWFYNGCSAAANSTKSGLEQLETKLKKNKGKTNIVVFNLGVNDSAATSGSKYKSKLAKTASYLKETYGCKLYYANIYTVNCMAMGRDLSIMQNIHDMNAVIDTLCDGGYFTKIDIYSYFLKNGWYTEDGIHPGSNTALSYYDYCMQCIGQNGQVTDDGSGVRR